LTTKQDEPDLLILAFTQIAARGWAGFRLSELARAAEVPLDRVRALLPTRAALLCRLGERLDAAMLGMDPGELAELEPRERVFELIMRRLDALAPFKPGLLALARERACDPALLLATVCNVARLTEWLMDAAGARATGLGALAGRKVLGLIYVRVFSVWLRDDTPDLARTLAELDKRLRQAEQLARWVHRPRRRHGPAAEAPPPPA
jgi:ubiquinone biosynthesis protein COQ9